MKRFFRYLKRMRLEWKLYNAKLNKREVVRIWAATGKEASQAIFNMYDKYEGEIKAIEKKLKEI